jgi:hypothetical protein
MRIVDLKTTDQQLYLGAARFDILAVSEAGNMRAEQSSLVLRCRSGRLLAFVDFVDAADVGIIVGAEW